GPEEAHPPRPHVDRPDRSAFVALRLERPEAADDAEQDREAFTMLEPFVAAEHEHARQRDYGVDDGRERHDLRPAPHSTCQLEAGKGEVGEHRRPDSVPPVASGHGDRATPTSHGTARRGYAIAFAPTCSPANRTTKTNEMSTTPPAAKRYSASPIGRSYLCPKP